MKSLEHPWFDALVGDADFGNPGEGDPKLIVLFELIRRREELGLRKVVVLIRRVRPSSKSSSSSPRMPMMDPYFPARWARSGAGGAGNRRGKPPVRTLDQPFLSPLKCSNVSQRFEIPVIPLRTTRVQLSFHKRPQTASSRTIFCAALAAARRLASSGS